MLCTNQNKDKDWGKNKSSVRKCMNTQVNKTLVFSTEPLEMHWPQQANGKNIRTKEKGTNFIVSGWHHLNVWISVSCVSSVVCWGTFEPRNGTIFWGGWGEAIWVTEAFWCAEAYILFCTFSRCKVNGKVQKTTGSSCMLLSFCTNIVFTHLGRKVIFVTFGSCKEWSHVRKWQKKYSAGLFQKMSPRHFFFQTIANCIHSNVGCPKIGLSLRENVHYHNLYAEIPMSTTWTNPSSSVYLSVYACYHRRPH